MKKIINAKPELLAPAGSLQIGITALKAGADAVYAGLSKFNARERTKNFSVEQMQSLVDFAHSEKKKVYVTFNTLIKDNEIPEVAKALDDLNKIQPDAIIIQDLGVLYTLKKYFPLLKVHASTQMAIHNSAGVNFLSKQGIERIILERQITNDELKMIVANSDAELEVFVHGALCCSLSGSCLLSSWLGGWSGNRGKCKQACRRRYYSNNESGFYLSTKDLYALEHVPLLKKLGIASLKIEGRLREADYVDNVVRAYRMVIDENSNNKEVVKEAKSILARVPSRTWSKGFSSKDDLAKVIEPNQLGVQGRHCGKVTSASRHGFELKVANPIRINDKIRIQPQNGDEGPAMIVTKMSVKGQSVKSAKPGQIAFINYDKAVKSGWNVYRLSQAKITEKSYTLPEKKTPIVPYINISDNNISIDIINFENFPAWNKNIKIEVAEKLSLSSEMIQKEFEKVASLNVRISNLKCTVQPQIYIPQKQLKKIRQEFYSWLSLQLSENTYSIKSGYKQMLEDFSKISIANKFTKVRASETIAVNRKNKFKGSILAMPLANAQNINTNCEIILPFFCPESLLSSVQKQISNCLEMGIKTFRVTSLYQLALLPDNADINIHISFPLPIANSFAVLNLINLGANKVLLWPELEEKNLVSILQKCGKACEIFVYGRISVLNTRANLPVSGKIRDKRGVEFRLSKEFGINLMLPKKVFSIEPIAGYSSYVDLTNAELNEKETYSFNFSGQLA